MAGITTIFREQGSGGDAVRLERASPDQRRQALALMLTGYPREEDPAVDQFLRFAHDQQLELHELWQAHDGRKPVAAALLVPSPGRTGMLFCSPVRNRAAADVSSRLIRAVCDAQRPARVRLLQSLLDPHQKLERLALEQASFEALAVLVYMQRAAQPVPGSRVDSPPPPINLGDPAIETVHYSEARRPLFARAIEASYEQTLDCPRLLGVRDIDDILDGHMATGTFDPQLWHVFVKAGEPAGVMLLAQVPPRQTVELVYLGVSLPWRGRGLARRMLTAGLDVAARRGAVSVVLAVDEDNAPALRLYRGLAFRPTARKAAMIRTLNDASRD